MAGKRAELQEDTQFRIMRLLASQPEMSQRELAKAAGVSAGCVHYVLSALVDMGYVKFSNFTAAEDKRRYAYILTPLGIAEKALITKRFLVRKIAEYNALRNEIDALQSEIEPDFAPIVVKQVK